MQLRDALFGTIVAHESANNIVCSYATQFSNSKVKNQQGLAAAMVGSVLVVFCGIQHFTS
jgi:hypothetical protein